MRLGLPARVIDEEEFSIDFSPMIERKIEPDGVVVNFIHYYDPVLQPYMERTDRRGRRPDFIFHYDPSDISRIWFFDETQKRYVPIPYRDIRRPPLTEWELIAAIKRARERGRASLDEDSIFRAYEENLHLVEVAVRKTKLQRRRKEAKNTTPGLGNKRAVEPAPPHENFESATPFEDIEL